MNLIWWLWQEERDGDAEQNDSSRKSAPEMQNNIEVRSFLSWIGSNFLSKF